MTTVLWRWHRELRLLPLLLALAGCGPGVGGTGTGDQSFPLSYFGAKAASVCNAAFAGQLKCPSRIVIGPVLFDVDEGSDLVVWSDDAANSRVTAKIDGSKIELEAHCDGVRFTGTWGQVGDDAGRFFGHYIASNLDFAVPGTLAVERSADGEELSYILADVAGDAVFGPVLLRRTNGELRLAQCPRVSSSPLPEGQVR